MPNSTLSSANPNGAQRAHAETAPKGAQHGHGDSGFHEHGYPVAAHARTDFRFTITDGEVTGMARVVGDLTMAVDLPANATFTTGGGVVKETLAYGGASVTLTYLEDAGGSGLYRLAQDVKNFEITSANARPYSFAIDGGVVTRLTESRGPWDEARTVDVSKLAATIFVVDGNTVTETSVQGNVVETLTYVTSDGASYQLASSTQVYVAGGSGTALFVDATERIRFTFSDKTVTGAMAVKADGSAGETQARAGLTTTYSLAAAGYVVETITDGTRTSYEVFHDGNGDGIYTAVAHGTGTTVDIVGLQAQITPLISALL